MYKEIKDNQTEVFLDSIPRWITHFGFGLTVLIFIGLITMTSMVSYPHTIALQVNITEEQNIATTDFSTYEQLAEQQKINIITPFGEINGTLKKSEAWAEQSNMHIPIDIDAAQKQSLVFKNELNCKAEIVLNNMTLLQKLVN